MKPEIGDVVAATCDDNWASYNKGYVEIRVGDSGWITTLEPDNITITMANTQAQIPFSEFPDCAFEIIKV